MKIIFVFEERLLDREERQAVVEKSGKLYQFKWLISKKYHLNSNSEGKFCKNI